MESPANVKIGESYPVPCVETFYGDILPVLLPAHRDGPENCLSDIGRHYHIDFRFLVPYKFHDKNAYPADQCSVPFMSKMKAIKESFNSLEIIGESAFFFINRWYRRNKNLTAKNNVCPHRNIKITNPCGTCPAHGLKWNLETKELADFVLPFYLELANNGIHHPDNPREEITDDSCVIEVHKTFSFDGTVIMVDVNMKHYQGMTQKISPMNLFCGDKVNFSTKTLCD